MSPGGSGGAFGRRRREGRARRPPSSAAGGHGASRCRRRVDRRGGQRRCRRAGRALPSAAVARGGGRRLQWLSPGGRRLLSSAPGTTTKKTTTLQRSRLPSRQRRQQRVRPHRGRRLRGLLGQHHVPKLMFAAEFGAMCLPQCQELHQKCLFSHVSNRRERQIFAGNFEKCGVAMKHSCKLKQICCRDFVFANSFANHCWHTHALECTKHKFAETNKNGEKSKFSTSDFARVSTKV